MLVATTAGPYFFLAVDFLAVDFFAAVVSPALFIDVTVAVCLAPTVAFLGTVRMPNRDNFVPAKPVWPLFEPPSSLRLMPPAPSVRSQTTRHGPGRGQFLPRHPGQPGAGGADEFDCSVKLGPHRLY